MKLFRQVMFADLEDYEDFDDARLKNMTDNQRRMIIEDERAKAKRNTGKIVTEHSKEGARKGAEEGRESGRKSGKKAGGIVGGISGGLLGASIGNNVAKNKKGALIGAGIGAGAGVAAGIGLGGHWGAKSGEREGRLSGARKGAAKGAKIAKEQGHDDRDVALRHSRTFDDYARRHKKPDTWETEARNTFKKEDLDHEERQRKARQEALMRRRIEAEEMKARAERTKAEAADRDSRTNRSRYYDEYFGWGEANKKKENTSNSGNTYTQYNYYR